MTVSIRQITIALLVFGISFVASVFVARESQIVLVGVGFVGAVASLLAAGGAKPRAVGELADALAQAGRGDRPPLPRNAGPELERVYQNVGQLAEQVRRDQQRSEQLTMDLRSIGDAVRALADGKRPLVPSDALAESKRVLEQIEQVADGLSRGRENDQARREAISNGASRLARLEEALHQRAQMAEESLVSVQQVTAALKSIGEHVAVLTASAQESSTSILEMTSTNDEVAESVVELAASVRETASSIEEMTYSVKEVAKNVDALSLTAEETSSSMNEMDISIDQVQSNANERRRG